MIQTPFLILQKRDKQRKKNLESIIQQKDLKKRILENKEKNNEKQVKELINTIENQHKILTFHHSVKKSTHQRKIMNRSLENHGRKEQLCTISHLSYGLQKPSKSKINKTVYQKQSWRKKLGISEEKLIFQQKQQKQQNTLCILNSEKTNKNQQMQKFISENLTGNRNINQIEQIANKRKLSIDFDIEVQGTRKKIDIVSQNSRKKMLKKQSAEYHHEEQRKSQKQFKVEDKELSKQFNSDYKSTNQQKKSYCGKKTNFLSKLKEQYERLLNSGNGNQIRISKQSKNVFSFNPNIGNRLIYASIIDNNNSNKKYHSMTKQEQRAKKYSSWEPKTPIVYSRKQRIENHIENSKKFQSKKKSKVQQPNDIQGWGEFLDNEEEFNEMTFSFK